MQGNLILIHNFICFPSPLFYGGFLCCPKNKNKDVSSILAKAFLFFFKKCWYSGAKKDACISHCRILMWYPWGKKLINVQVCLMYIYKQSYKRYKEPFDWPWVGYSSHSSNNNFINFTFYLHPPNISCWKRNPAIVYSFVYIRNKSSLS